MLKSIPVISFLFLFVALLSVEHPVFADPIEGDRTYGGVNDNGGWISNRPQTGTGGGGSGIPGPNHPGNGGGQGIGSGSIGSGGGSGYTYTDEPIVVDIPWTPPRGLQESENRYQQSVTTFERIRNGFNSSLQSRNYTDARRYLGEMDAEIRNFTNLVETIERLTGFRPSFIRPEIAQVQAQRDDQQRRLSQALNSDPEVQRQRREVEQYNREWDERIQQTRERNQQISESIRQQRRQNYRAIGPTAWPERQSQRVRDLVRTGNTCQGCPNSNCNREFFEREVTNICNENPRCPCGGTCDDDLINGYRDHYFSQMPEHNTISQARQELITHSQSAHREVQRINLATREGLVHPRVTAQLEQQITDYINQQTELAEQMAQQAETLSTSSDPSTFSSLRAMSDFASDLAQSTHDYVNGVASGIYNGFSDTSTALANTALAIYNNPRILEHLSTHIMNTITDPTRFLTHMRESLVRQTRAMLYGSPFERGEALGRFTSETLLTLATFEGTGANEVIRNLTTRVVEAGAGSQLGERLLGDMRGSPRFSEGIAEIELAAQEPRVSVPQIEVVERVPVEEVTQPRIEPVRTTPEIVQETRVRIPESSVLETESVAVEELRATLQNGSREYPHSTYWNRETTFDGNRVFQRNDLVDPNRVYGQTGETNLQLMERGRAPIGPDGEPIQLHHLIQTPEGAIAEVTATFHRGNSRIIHINQPARDFPSLINRSQFDAWRERYWINRARDFQ